MNWNFQKNKIQIQKKNNHAKCKEWLKYKINLNKTKLQKNKGKKNCKY